jgi:hypothetical protein
VNGPALRVRDLSTGARIGLTCLLLVIIGGIVASVTHLYLHYENRDEQPGLSIVDIKGAFHGVQSTAPLLTAVDTNHPAELEDAEPDDILSDEERQVLLDWLMSDRISEDYDNLDLGYLAPAEIIATRCLGCHARNAPRGGDIGQTMPLEFFDDVKAVAFSREINPTPLPILTISTHTHALSMATMSLVVAILLVVTRLPRRVVGATMLLLGAALLVDIASWWITRRYESFAWVIVGAGGIYNGLMVLTSLVIIADLWLPRTGREPID